MPTFQHNALVEMFRENPELGPRLLARLFHVEVPSHASVAVIESSLDQLLPVELRADLVLELRNEAGVTVLVIVLEVQRGQDPDKRYVWPVYVTAVRARKRCPSVLLAVAPDAAVADWAARPIDLGLGLGTLRALVLGPSSVPVVTDPRAAEQDAALAVLSAMAHGNGPHGIAVIQAALDAMPKLDPEHRAVYFQVIWRALHEPMQRALEALVMERQIADEAMYPPFIQKILDKHELEAELKGKREGELKGKREGEIEGKRDALLRIAARAALPLTEEDRARIQACSDSPTFDRWIDNVLEAKSGSDLFR